MRNKSLWHRLGDYSKIGVAILFAALLLALDDIPALTEDLNGLLVLRWVAALLFLVFAISQSRRDLESENQTLRARIDELEATKADIHLTVQRSAFTLTHGSPHYRGAFTPKVGGDGFCKNGLPAFAVLSAEIDIRNIGQEVGELKWELDDSQTKIPSMFAVMKDDGSFLFCQGKEFGPGIQGKKTARWYLYFQIAEEQRDPKAFAKALRYLEDYTVAIRYWTDRIDGPSEPRILHIEGDFREYRQKIAERWSNPHYSDLLELAGLQALE